VVDPTLGLFSDTDLSLGATLSKTMADMQSDVIQGRKSLNDWDSAVKTWKSKGGDKIRAEYESSLAQTDGQ
jgi:putative aldouronate transport system substrate-binding protein